MNRFSLIDAGRSLLCALGRLLLSLRYRVTIRGLEGLKDPALQQGTIILPNHPSLTEPIMTIAHIWPYLHPRPMLFSVNFQSPLIHWIMGFFRAVQVPVTVSQSAAAREGAEKAVREVIDGLRKGDNIVMWPAGRIYSQPYERLGGASALAEILKALPEAKIVAVRTRGMWGSTFSFAFRGRNPDLMPSFRRSIGCILGNCLLFSPRRPIDVTIEVLDRSRLPEPVKERINPFFESWYNKEGPEEARFVPYHFLFGPRHRDFPPLFDEYAVDFAAIKGEIRKAVREIIEERLRRPVDESLCTASTRLDELGLDSLDRMELSSIVEGRFGFKGDMVPVTFGQLAALAAGTLKGADVQGKPVPSLWFRKSGSDEKLAVRGDTIARAFVRQALCFRRDIAAADETGGVVTYEKMLVSVCIMAGRLRKVDNKCIGILLPSSVACSTIFMAVHMAGKLPVMLNWTTGPAYLAHAAKVMGLTHIVTSRRFVDRLSIAVEGTEYLYLEDIRKGISRVEMISTFLKVRLFGGAVEASAPHPSPADTAVVLFTSGSEKAPKAVPLTHENLISNVMAGIGGLKPTRQDSLLAILPPFHSFGLTATMLLPLLTGMKTVHHADPTDGAGLARKIAAYRPTAFFLTPTFLSHVLDKASESDLSSLTTIVTGAEKTPDALFRKCSARAPGATLYEGYGITECSPIVSLNGPGAVRKGTIGRAAPGMEVAVVDYESLEPLPSGAMGMLLVSGPSVFPGYLAYEGESPFLDRGGKRWYITGDLGVIDSEGYITFSGRLRRFLKAGGEMISLPALEEPLAQKYPATEDGPRVALEGVEHQEGRTIVLFTTCDITSAEANAVLAARGFKGIMRIDEVRKVEKIPLLGTGKTDYKVLRKKIEERE